VNRIPVWRLDLLLAVAAQVAVAQVVAHDEHDVGLPDLPGRADHGG
jgi:hypothetical protein